MGEQFDCSCPKCGSDKTVGLPMVYASGTSSIEAFSFYIGTKKNYGVIPTFGSSQTLAAKQLAPPQKKSSQVAGFVVFGLMFLAFGGFFALAGSSSQGPEGSAYSQIGWGAIAIGLPIAIVGAIFTHRSAKTYNETVWQPLYEEWQDSFICKRCGTIFRPVDLRGQIEKAEAFIRSSNLGRVNFQQEEQFLCKTCHQNYPFGGFERIELCWNLRDVFPHDPHADPPNPNPFARYWLAVNGYPLPPRNWPTDQLWFPEMSALQDPASALAELGRKYYAVNPNPLWDAGFGDPPAWYQPTAVEENDEPS